MISLSLQLRGTPLHIADELPGAGCDLPGLQKLIGGTLTADSVASDVALRASSDAQNHCRFEEKSWRYTYEVTNSCIEQNKVLLWKKTLLLAFAARILRGEKFMPVHGCLLKDIDGKGVLLCGQSGMGKTTTSNRWKAAGGEVASDDMILLEYGEKTLYGHPLPTWSRCLESLAGESVMFEESVPIRTVLALSRGEKTESILEVEGFKYMSAVYSACSLFNLSLVKNAGCWRQDRLSEAIKGCAALLYERFPHRMFFASLDGDIRQTFGNYLQENS